MSWQACAGCRQRLGGRIAEVLKIMKHVIVVVMLGMTLVLALGCAQKQEEATKLEQEILDQEQPVTDSMGAAVDAVPDSVEHMTATPDASAIPQEDTSFEQPPPVGAGYTVQVGACKNIEYSRHLVDTYTQRGYEPFLTSAVIDGETFYRVRIGSTEGYSEAKSLQDELTDKYSVAEIWIDEISE